VDEHDARHLRRRQDARARLEAGLARSRRIGLGKSRRIGLREEGQTVAPRAAGRRLGRAAPHDSRASGSKGDRRHARHRLRFGSLPQHVKQLLELAIGDRAALLVIQLVELILDRPVADAEDVAHPALAHVVEHDHLLGETHRVVHRQQRRRHQDLHVPCHGRHRRSQNERRREVAVLRAVMLRQADVHGAFLVGPLGHLDRRPIFPRDLGGGHTRSSQVEAHPEHRIDTITAAGSMWGRHP
jgi:hypothetical protein